MKNLEEEKGFYSYTIEEMCYTNRTPAALSDLIFHDPSTGVKVSKMMYMYGCPTRIMQEPEKGAKPLYIWRIAAATSTHSVFILKRVNFKNKFTLEAFIENLFPEYILYIVS